MSYKTIIHFQAALIDAGLDEDEAERFAERFYKNLSGASSWEKNEAVKNIKTEASKLSRQSKALETVATTYL